MPHVPTMLVILVLYFATNCFIKTDAYDSNGQNAEAYSSASADDGSSFAVASSAASTYNQNNPDYSHDKPVASYDTPDACGQNATLNCSDSEILDECPSYCPSDYCPTGDGQNAKCPQPKPCPPPACKCRFNHRRAQNGTCIPTRDCPPFKCTKPNEEYVDCPSYCPTDDCSQATPTGKCPLPGRILIVVECRPTCRCAKGFWRNNGTCVPYNQCPGKLTCGPNEVVDNCPAKCTTDYCPTSRNQIESCTKPCPCPPPACKCTFNHRRAKNGTCIPTTSCPPFECNEPNEEYNPCPPLCPTDDCSQATPDGRCPLFGVIGIVLQCNPRCRCKEHFWRKNGTCVPYDQCRDMQDRNQRSIE